jgi:DNA polymerase-1
MLSVNSVQVRPLQDYRKIFKLYSTYVRPLRNLTTAGIDKNERTQDQHLCRDSRIHASFLLTGTRGGRLSCRNPNLQQLPREGDVKSMFVSRFTKQGRKGCLYQGDLSQIELRLLAAGCGDPSMVQAYFDDIDLHTLTTSRIFKIPYEHFSKDYMKSLQEKGRDKEAKQLNEKRQIGKTVNFLTGYGGGAFGLQTTLAARSIYLPIEECETIIESFFDSYPSLKRHLQHYKHFIQETGVAVSILGRVRIFEEVFSEDKEAISKALRAGCNHLIQSTASDMMLIALVAIENLMREAGLESILVSTVHDSLLIDAIQEELPKIHEIVTMVLNNFDKVLPAYFGDDYDTSWMIVPFAGDCEIGLNYLDSKQIPKSNIDWDVLLYPKIKELSK